MEKLRSFLNSLKPPAQADFARRCKTTVGYLRKAISVGQTLNSDLCICIEKESARQVVCEDLRADVDWGFLRGTAVVVAANDAAHPAHPSPQQEAA